MPQQYEKISHIIWNLGDIVYAKVYTNDRTQLTYHRFEVIKKDYKLVIKTDMWFRMFGKYLSNNLIFRFPDGATDITIEMSDDFCTQFSRFLIEKNFELTTEEEYLIYKIA
jgi:hypothetical protein